MPTSAPLSEVPTRAGCTILPATSWDFYERFLEEFDECRVPHSYVDGELRIMSPSFRHESPKRFIARLVDTLTEELNIPCRSMGAILLKSALTEKGAEPDEGYLIQNEAALRGRLDYDPTTDPSLNRLPVYAALGVPEVWVYDGETLVVKLLQDNESYSDSEASSAFPFLPMRDFACWIDKACETDETTWIRDFRQWVRATIKPSE